MNYEPMLSENDLKEIQMFKDYLKDAHEMNERDLHKKHAKYLGLEFPEKVSEDRND